jgi:menaquinone-9 beta-reductase
MVMIDQPHVLVVGGGPAGSSTAIRLARSGIDVTLIDRAKFPREKACAEYCSPGVVDALEELGALPRVMEREHAWLSSMQIVARNQPIPLDFDDDRPDGNAALGIKRSVLDSELLNLASDSGTTVFEKTRALRPIVEGGRVCGVVARSDSDEREIRADFVVVADGLNSTIARSLDLDRPIRWPRRLGLVARFTGMPEQITAGQMHVGNDIYCGLSPVSDGEANVSLVVQMGSKPAGQTAGEFFDQMIRTLPGIDLLLGDARRISDVRGVGPLGGRARKPCGAGYLLVGDASGFFDPLTGEGVHRALNGGKIASRATTRALGRSDRMPVGYRRARKKMLRDKQRVCQIIQLMLGSPAAIDYFAHRARTREEVRETLCGVLGDYVPARLALQPGFLWNLLRP